ncbi:MAG: DUF4230 domain-containing protein [Chloroflexota bacterium]|nr:DUF4230 domain-containing protein [Chloroflexota bacterium]
MDETQVNSGERGDWQYVDGRAVRPGDSVRILPGDPEETSPVGRGSGRLEPYEPSPGSTGMRNVGTKAQARSAAPNEATSAAPPTVVQVKRGPTACAILAGTFAILALSCALLGFATLRGGLDRLGGVLPNFSFTVTPTVTINSQPAVISQIRGLSRLETVNYQLEKVVTGKSSGPLPDLLTSDKILLVAHGEVVAGIDLSRLQPEDVTVVSGTVTITMPKAEVLYTRLDNEKTYVYDRQTGIFSKPDPNLETEMRRVAEREILEAALEDGILDKATENAHTVLRTLVTGLGYEDVRFKQAP